MDMSKNLASQKCKPCEEGGEPLREKDIDAFMNEVDKSWSLTKCTKKISRDFKFKDFIQALEFVNKIGAIAEDEGHHPDITLKWGFVRLEIWTHAVGGLTQNDFILAAKIDTLN